MPGNPKFDPFHLVKIAPKLEKSPDRNHKLISSEGGQDTVAYHISGHSLNTMGSIGYARKPQIWPVSLSQNSAKITKINRP